MNDCNLPTHKQCFEIISSYRVPLNIIRHSQAVAGFAVALAEKLNANGLKVNIDLVQRGSLLHDMVRVCDIDKLDYSKFEQTVTDADKAKWAQLREEFKDVSHENAAYELLKDEYPQLALAIRRHKYCGLADPKEKPQSWEEKLIYYADKRVLHDKIVSLKQRLADGHIRNAHIQKRHGLSKTDIKKIDFLLFELEEEILRNAKL